MVVGGSSTAKLLCAVATANPMGWFDKASQSRDPQTRSALRNSEQSRRSVTGLVSRLSRLVLTAHRRGLAIVHLTTPVQVTASHYNPPYIALIEWS